MFHRHIHRTYAPDGIYPHNQDFGVGVYFVTTDVRFHVPFFSNVEIGKVLEQTIWWSKRVHRCTLYAYVIMPDHLHILLQPTMTNISKIMYAIKINSSRDIHTYTHSRGIDTSAMGWFTWQQSFYDHVIRDDRDFRNHIEYIRYNPVRAGLCTVPEDYPFLFVDEEAVSGAMGF